MGARVAALDVWMGLVGCALKLERDNKQHQNLPDTGDRYVLSGWGCPDQCGHTDFPVRQGRNLDVFIIVSEMDSYVLHVCPGQQVFVHYPMTT